MRTSGVAPNDGRVSNASSLCARSCGKAQWLRDAERAEVAAFRALEAIVRIQTAVFDQAGHGHEDVAVRRIRARAVVVARARHARTERRPLAVARRGAQIADIAALAVRRARAVTDRAVTARPVHELAMRIARILTRL